MNKKNVKVNNAIIFLIISAVLTLYMFYLDEGYFSFQWMKSFGNWIIYFVYVAIIFLIQFGIGSLVSLITSKLIRDKYKQRTFLFAGITPIVVFLFLLFNHLIFQG